MAQSRTLPLRSLGASSKCIICLFHGKLVATRKSAKALQFETQMRSEAFMAVKIQVMLFWLITPCSLLCRYQCFEGTYYLHAQGKSEDGDSMLHLSVGTHLRD
jgi:hypothetical protein